MISQHWRIDKLLRAIGHLPMECISHHPASCREKDVWWILPANLNSLWIRNFPFPKKFVPNLGTLVCREVPTQFTELVKEFVRLQSGQAFSTQAKSQPSKEDFEDLGFTSNPVIDSKTYLVIFLACWLSGQIFADVSRYVPPKTFLMAVERPGESNIV